MNTNKKQQTSIRCIWFWLGFVEMNFRWFGLFVLSVEIVEIEVLFLFICVETRDSFSCHVLPLL